MPNRTAIAIALGAGVLASSATPRASAQARASSTETDPRSQGEALFREARRAMEAQEFIVAKQKLEASHRLLPGPGTLLNLGYCYERLGLPANAYRAYSEAAELGAKMHKLDRVRAANARLAVLKKRVGLVSLVLSEKGASVTVDGVPVDVTNKVPLEEGRHLLRVTAPGRAPWQSELQAEKGERIRIVVPALAAESSAAAPSPPPKVTVEKEPEDLQPSPYPDEPVPPDPESDWPVQRTLGIAVAGAGLVAVGVGTILGLNAVSTYDSTRAHCDDSVCDARGVELTDSAKTSALWSTIAFGAGAAAIAGGAFLFFTAKTGDSAHAKVRVMPSMAGLSITLGKDF